MNYERIYTNIIKVAKERKLDSTIYTERHHIVPSCKGGSDDAHNLVELLPREHFICHWLLHLMNPKDFQLLAAWNAFCRGKKREVSHNYERCRIKWIEELKMRKNTHPEWWNNWTKNGAGKNWINNGKKSKRVIPTEKDKWLSAGWQEGRLTFERKPHSEEHKRKLILRIEERKKSGWNSPLKGKKLSSPAQLAGLEKMKKTRQARGSFLSDEEREERKKQKEIKTIICPHCGKSGGKSIMKRWHLDRCKLRPSN